MRNDPTPVDSGAQDHTTQTLLKSALRNAGLGCWTWDLATGEVALSAEAQGIFGESGPHYTFEAWLLRVDPSDTPRLATLEETVRRGQRTFSFEYVFTTPAGARSRLKSDGEVVSLDERGAPRVVVGTVLALGDSAPDGPRDARPSPPGWWTRADRAYSWRWEQDANYRFTILAGGEQRRVPELEHALGRARWELPHAVPLHSSWGEHIRTLEARQPFRNFEYRVGQGPHAVCFSISGEPVFDTAGRFRGYSGTAHEITHRVNAESEARHARMLLQQASRLARIGGWTLRVSSMEVEWTPEGAKLLGCPGDEPLAWDQAFGALQEPYLSQLSDHVAACVAQHHAFRMEALVVQADGSERWLEIIGEPDASVTGSPRRVIGAVKDVSERKVAVRQLHELNEQLATTFESITSGFYMLDRQWRFTYANHETERVTVLPRSELLGRSVLELFPWVIGSRLHEAYLQAMFGGRAAQVEVFLEKLGVWAEVHVYPAPHGIAVYFNDITDRKLAQDALRASEERHRLLFQVSLDALFQVEHESGRIVAANAAACEMFGLSEAKMRERGRSALVSPRETRTQELHAQVDRAGSGRGCLTLLRADGNEFDAELSGALFRGADGVVYASVAVRDISEHLRQEAEIRALNESLAQKVRARTAELEAANDELKAFAHSLAHDLRTPIAAITALSHVLEQRMPAAAEKDRQYATRIRQAAQQLDEYVGALLAHARLSHASMTPRRVDLSAMAECILEDLRVREPHRAVTTDVERGLSAVGDPTLLRMVLENLLGNAWKFTRERPDARIRINAEAGAEGFSTFCVSDNGDGFDMEYAHKLFGTFERLHTQAEFPGTGIGLANVKRIVLRHGGRVWAAGRPGAGACFCFALPHVPAPVTPR